MAAYIISFAALLFASLFIFRDKKLKKMSCILLAAALVIEVFWFNSYAVGSLFKKEDEFSLSVSDESVRVGGASSSAGENRAVLPDGGRMSVSVSDIARRVVSVSPIVIPYGSENGSSVKISVSAADDSYSMYNRELFSDKTVSPTAESKVFPVELTGNCRKMLIDISAVGSGSAELVRIDFNKKIPFVFSVWRLLSFAFIAAFLYLLIAAPWSKRTLADKKDSFSNVSAVITAVAFIACIALAAAARIDDYGSFEFGFSRDYGNQMTKELVDAFESGHLWLNDVPGEKLTKLENPYDWSLRIANGVDAKWDHLLFEGKYYSYYGIAPVLLLFLPFHALTGIYFSSLAAILLFSGIGVIFLSALFGEYAERFCKKIPNGVLAAALVAVLCSSGIWYSLCFSNFYEIAQSAGFMFTCAGFYFLLRSNVIGGEKIKKPSLALSSSMLALAVLSRPTLALYCVTALIFIFFGLKKESADKSCRLISKKTVPYLLSALVPFAVFGGVQCIYNFARFGSPLDFGIQYSLTINDFTKSEFYADFFNISFYNFILAFPVIKPVFPFFFSSFSKLGAAGYYFVANENAVGILWRALPSLGYLGVVPAFKKLDKEEKKRFLFLAVPVGILAPLIIIFSIWESGYGVRYCADFSWQIVLVGTSVLFILYERVFDRQLKRVFEILFPVAALLALAVNFALLFDYCAFTGTLRDMALAFAEQMSQLQ